MSSSFLRLLSRTEQAGSPGSVSVAPAVELFVERARATRPDFELTEENATTVAQICRRVDGLPLAIELAASLVKLLSPEAILRRLDTRFELLTGERATSRRGTGRFETLSTGATSSSNRMSNGCLCGSGYSWAAAHSNRSQPSVTTRRR